MLKVKLELTLTEARVLESSLAKAIQARYDEIAAINENPKEKPFSDLEIKIPSELIAAALECLRNQFAFKDLSDDECIKRLNDGLADHKVGAYLILLRVVQIFLPENFQL